MHHHDGHHHRLAPAHGPLPPPPLLHMPPGAPATLHSPTCGWNGPVPPRSGRACKVMPEWGPPTARLVAPLGRRAATLESRQARVARPPRPRGARRASREGLAAGCGRKRRGSGRSKCCQGKCARNWEGRTWEPGAERGGQSQTDRAGLHGHGGIARAWRQDGSPASLAPEPVCMHARHGREQSIAEAGDSPRGGVGDIEGNMRARPYRRPRNTPALVGQTKDSHGLGRARGGLRAARRCRRAALLGDGPHAWRVGSGTARGVAWI